MVKRMEGEGDVKKVQRAKLRLKMILMILSSQISEN